MTSPVRPLAVDEQVGNYKILGTAGVGGMGIVYKALDLKLNRTVALKFLPDEVTAAARDRDRFLQEARTASALDHSNIGVIHGLETTADGHTFIVMAYYEGLTLAEKIRQGPLASKEAVEIMTQLAHGLAEAHDHSIIHRDIKPTNVIMTRQNISKIVDFGLAHVGNRADSTQTVGPAGTLAYMSPEQVRNEPVDLRTDIWSLGVVFAEMLTGRHPFARQNMSAVLLAILEQPPPVDNLDPLLAPIVCCALAKDRTHRYSDCRELLVDLEASKPELGPTPGPQPFRKPRSSSRDFRRVLEHASSPRAVSGGFVRAKRLALELAALILFFIAVSFLSASVRQWVAEHLFPSGQTEKHIAVLPFDNIGNDPANVALSEGLMDSLTGKLSNLDLIQQAGFQSLWVVPASEVRRRKIDNPVAALREFGATLVVKGSLMRDSSGVHLTINLIRTRDIQQVGSLSLQDPSGDFASLENQAVSGLARLMHLEIPVAVLNAANGNAPPAVYESYLKALGYMQRYDKPGNLDQAIAALSNAVNTDPQFALGYAGLGEAYRLKFQLDKNPNWTEMAVTNGTKATALNGSLPSAYVTLGRIHDDAGKNDLAISEFQHALELDARNSDALTGMAHAYEHAARFGDAEASYKRAIALRPDYWDGHNSLGIFYQRQGRYEEAVAQYRRAIEFTPDNAQAYSNLGSAYVDWGDSKKFPEAEKALRKSLELSPGYPAYANLGYLYALQGRFRESAAATEKALQLNDRDFIVWANLALAYEGLHDQAKLEAAQNRELPLLEAAAQSRPRDASVQSRLALLYAEKKQREKALTRAQTSLALLPEDPDVWETLGETYETLGDRKRAIKCVQTSLRKGFSMETLKTVPVLKGLLADPNFRAISK